MKAIVVNRSGLVISTVPDPVQPAGTVRVKVRYAGVGFADGMAIAGGYPLAPSGKFSPGYECVGTVVETGQRVAVMLPRMGAYREFVDIDPSYAVPIPETLDDSIAAALPLNYLTAWGMLHQNPLSSEKSFLIHGAAGGVGRAVLENARLKGLRAFGLASKLKRDQVSELGAEWLDSGSDWPDALHRAVPQGLDAAFDCFGVASMKRDWSVLGPSGKLVAYGFSPTSRGGLWPMVHGLAWTAVHGLFGAGKTTGVFSCPQLIYNDRAWYRSTLSELMAMAVAGHIKPKIHGAFPWEKVKEAQQLIENRQAIGKILLDFS